MKRSLEEEEVEKEEEEGTEKSVTEQALRESRAKFLSITLFKRVPIRTYMTVKMGRNYPLPGEKMDFEHNKLDYSKCYVQLH